MKNGFKLLAVLGVTSSLLVACGNNDAKKTDSSTKDAKSASVSKKAKQSKKETSEIDTEALAFDTFVDSAKTQIEPMKQQYASIYSDIEIKKAGPYEVEYIYTFLNTPNPGTDWSALKQVLVKGLKPIMDGVKDVIPQLKITVTYLSPNKEQLQRYTITSKDTDAIPAEAPAEGDAATTQQ